MHSIIAILALASSVVAQTSTGAAPSYAVSPSLAAYSTGYATGVVTELITYCPTPTVFVCDSKSYTVSTPTTLTIACPTGCVVTTPVTYNVPKPTQPAMGTPASVPASAPSAAATTIKPATYLGAADRLQIGGALAVVALGAAML